MKKIFLLLLIMVLFFLFQGCRTLNPKEGSDNTQPWAQPESWERSLSLPGFSRPDEMN